MCMYMTCLYCNTHMYASFSLLAYIHLHKTRVSKTSQLLPFGPLPPLSHPPVTATATLLSLPNMYHHRPLTNPYHQLIYACSSCIHHHKYFSIISKLNYSTNQLPYSDINKTIQRMPQEFTIP
jgi:hypothetical protein